MCAVALCAFCLYEICCPYRALNARLIHSYNTHTNTPNAHQAHKHRNIYRVFSSQGMRARARSRALVQVVNHCWRAPPPCTKARQRRIRTLDTVRNLYTHIYIYINDVFMVRERAYRACFCCCCFTQHTSLGSETQTQAVQASKQQPSHHNDGDDDGADAARFCLPLSASSSSSSTTKHPNTLWHRLEAGAMCARECQ